MSHQTQIEEFLWCVSFFLSFSHICPYFYFTLLFFFFRFITHRLEEEIDEKEEEREKYAQCVTQFVCELLPSMSLSTSSVYSLDVKKETQQQQQQEEEEEEEEISVLSLPSLQTRLGCLLRGVLFSLLSPDTHSLIHTKHTACILRWLPFLSASLSSVPVHFLLELLNDFSEKENAKNENSSSSCSISSLCVALWRILMHTLDREDGYAYTQKEKEKERERETTNQLPPLTHSQ